MRLLEKVSDGKCWEKTEHWKPLKVRKLFTIHKALLKVTKEVLGHAFTVIFQLRLLPLSTARVSKLST